MFFGGICTFVRIGASLKTSASFRQVGRNVCLKTLDDRKKAQNATPGSGRGPGSPEGFCWGFCAVVCCTMGLAAFLMFSAWGRFSGVAWGSLKENRDNANVSEGFISVDMSDAYEGGERVFSLVGEPLSSDPLPEEPDEHLSVSQEERSEPEPQPKESAALPPLTAKVDELNLPLPLPVTEDFGPLPKDLSDFELIILNT